MGNFIAFPHLMWKVIIQNGKNDDQLVIFHAFPPYMKRQTKGQYVEVALIGWNGSIVISETFKHVWIGLFIGPSVNLIFIYSSVMV
jgi:hypothetical protein